MVLKLHGRYLAIRGWVLSRLRRQRGIIPIEYVMVLMAVSLFLIVAAVGLRPVLNRAVNKVGNWVNAVNIPALPGGGGGSSGSSD